MTDALLILPPVGRRPTGIGHYARRLVDALTDLDKLDVAGYTPPKKELTLWGTRWGGYISSWYNALLGSLPEAELVHALDLQQLHRSADVLTVHDLVALDNPDAYGAAGHLWRLFARRIPNLEAIITPSRYTAHRVTDELDVDPDKVTVAPHGIDDHLFEPLHPADVLDDRHGHHVATVGEWRPRKNIGELCKALVELDRETDQPVTLHHAGPSRVDLESYEAACARLLHRSDVTLRRHGYMGDRALATLLSWADVLAFPSQDEGFGLPPIEAAACGTPSVVGPCPVFDETLGDLAYHTQGTKDSIKQALAAALERPAKRRQLVNHARTYTWQAAAKKTASVYREVLA